jgi:hypothetical protein
METNMTTEISVLKLTLHGHLVTYLKDVRTKER